VGAVEVQTDAFLTSATDAIEWLSELCTCMTVRKEISWDLGPFWPREILKKITAPAGDRSLVPQPVYYYYDQRRRQEYAGPRADHDRAGPENRYLDWYDTANTDYV